MKISAFPSPHLLAVFIVISSYVCSTMSCLESERQALFMLKGGLVDEYNHLGSWVDVGGGNCCDWYGISCNNSTGHVVGLNLIGLGLKGIISSAIGNLTSLTELRLAGPHDGRLEIGGRGNLKSIGQLCHLKALVLGGVKVNQDVVDIFHDLFSSCLSNGLEELDLHSTGIFGNLTNVPFQKFKSLVNLYLWKNSISGSLPLSFGELQSIENVDIDDNLMAGVVSEAHFQKLHKLKSFTAGSNKQLEMEVSPSWIPPFQLTKLSLRSWQLGKHFPHWLRTQRNLKFLNLSYCGIKDTIPSWFWNMPWPLEYLGISGNNIFGEIQSMAGHAFREGVEIFLGSNQLAGQVPIFSSKVQYLDLSNNSFDSVSKEFWNSTKSLFSLILANNRIIGELPSSWPIAIRKGGEIDLSSNYFTGQVPSISSNLSSLDLSNNSLGSISKGFWNSTKSLISLFLANNRIVGKLPSSWPIAIREDGVIDLSSNYFTGEVPSFSSNLSALDLSNNSLGSISKGFWNSTKSLMSLFLANNRIVGKLPSSWPIAIREDGVIDLSSNYFTGEVPSFSSNLSALDLSNNLFESMPKGFWNSTKSLTSLILANNRIVGELPSSWPIAIKEGGEIDLSSNYFTGQVPSISSNLSSLDLSNNSLGSISKEFWNSTKSLISLFLANNRIVGELPNSWPIAIREGGVIDLSSNYFTGQVPSSNLFSLDLSNNSLGSISKGFWNCTKSLMSLFLANNHIVGKLPSSWPIAIREGGVIDLSSNYFTGEVPSFSSNLSALDLSNNSFIGSISHFLCHETNGPKELAILNLGDNLLSGEIPDCWNSWKNLRALKLNNNNFTGGLPSSMPDLSLLESLHVRNNSLTGGLPLLLMNNQNLVVVDLAENQLEGKIPVWIGKSNLTILDLRSNKFHGRIPDEVCSLASLQILDFASNNLTGHIPHCISKLQGLVTSGTIRNVLLDENSWKVVGDYAEDVIVVMKGRVMEYGNTLNLVRLIDLSSNSLSGDIPAGVTTLVALQSLNLSHNLLTGEIPREIGAMKKMESLDMSMNKLSGQIPESITSLTFLSTLNLSSNNLTGAVPLSTQLQGFNASCFSGNDLCGPPLARSCTPITGTPTGGATEQGHHDHVKWFWVSAAFGFVLGFWVVVFPVFYSRKWRSGFFGILDHIWDFLLVIFGRYHRF